MAIVVKLNASLRRLIPNYNPSVGLSLPYYPTYTVIEILNYLNIPSTQVNIIIVNGFFAELNSLLKDDDQVSLFPAIGGG